MLTAKNNDILFDDLAGQPATFPIMYSECDDRFEVETAENPVRNGDCTSYTLIDNGDCSN